MHLTTCTKTKDEYDCEFTYAELQNRMTTTVSVCDCLEYGTVLYVE